MDSESRSRITAAITAFNAFTDAVRNGADYEQICSLKDDATFQNLGMMIDFTMDFDVHMRLLEFDDIEIVEAVTESVRDGKSAENLLSQIDEYVHTLFQLLES